MRYFTLVLLIFCAFYLNGQEICTNGIDDDGDGLIDLNDGECACDTIKNYVFNSDFDSKHCCPETWTLPDTALDQGAVCLQYWKLLDSITTDYYHTCGFLGETLGLIPPPPLPFPSGDGCIGFHAGSNGGELIYQCLRETLLAGITYQVSFYYASSGAEEIQLWGHEVCSDDIFPDVDTFNMFPFGDYYCINDPDWKVLSPIELPFAPATTWSYLTFDITPATDVNQIVLGGDCSEYNAFLGYCYIDGFRITDIDSLTAENITAEAECPNVRLVYGSFVNTLTYQWFHNGIAVSGATSIELVVPPGLPGEYQMMIDDGSRCALSNTLNVSAFPTLTDISGQPKDVSCFGNADGQIELQLPSDNPPYIILWNTGASDSTLTGLSPDSYSVTIVDNSDCSGILDFDINQPDSFYLKLNVNYLDCLGDQDASIDVEAFGGISPYRYMWSTGDTVASLSNLGPDIYRVEVSDSNGCLIMEVIEISDPPQLESVQSHMLCDGQSIEINGIEYNSPGHYTQNFTSQNGCDSFLNILISVSHSIVQYHMNACLATFNDSAYANYDEFTPEYPVALDCGQVSAGVVHRSNSGVNGHSCTPGVNGSVAACVGSMDQCSYDVSSDKPVKFEINITPDQGDQIGLGCFSFYEKAPANFDWINGNSGPNNYPTLYTLRILKNGNEIYREEDIPTTGNWSIQSFDFYNMVDFLTDEATTYQFELLPYCLAGNGSQVSAWDIDEFDIQAFCNQPMNNIISGHILTTDGLPISHVEVTNSCYEFGFEAIDYSDENGQYVFNDILVRHDYLLESLNNDHNMNGISTLDFLIIRNHI